MPRHEDPKRRNIVLNAVKAATKKPPKGISAEISGRFLAHYYDATPLRDIEAIKPVDLASVAASHLAHAVSRKPGKACVRVERSGPRHHGWIAGLISVEIVTDNMPFLIDSVSAAINGAGLEVRMAVHPVIRVRRDGRGKLLDVLEAGLLGADDDIAESYMHLEVVGGPDTDIKEIKADLEGVLSDIRCAVDDWHDMRAVMANLVDELESLSATNSIEDIIEVRNFLRWMHDDHYTFLGYREYEFSGSGAKAKVAVNKKSGLGVLREHDRQVLHELHDLQAMSPEVRAFIKKPDLLMITKSNVRSTIHRSVHMDSIGIKRLDAKGKVIGLRTFVGLFTAAAYNRSPRDIPLIRRKITQTFDHAGMPTTSHNGKALFNILETYPRDELFQISIDKLLEIAMGILQLQERQQVALFLRPDDFERFISCLVYIPRERYTTDLRLRMQVVLEDTFHGRVTSHFAQLGESALARLHIIVRTTPGNVPVYDAHTLEAQLVETARSWSDHLGHVLEDKFGEKEGKTHHLMFRDAFPAGYRDAYEAIESIEDVIEVERTARTRDLGMNLHRPVGTAEGHFRFKVYHPEGPLPLSNVLPILEHLGLMVMDEMPYRISPAGAGCEVMIHDFGVKLRNGDAASLKAVRDSFHDAFRRVWQGNMESDGLNALILKTGIHPREIIVLRAYMKYLRQARIAFSQKYMVQTLVDNPKLAQKIVQYFLSRFTPTKDEAKAKKHQQKATRTRNAIMRELEHVSSADQDRILRRFVNLVDASLRTNYFQVDDKGQEKAHLSIKFDSSAIEELPLPRPLREIFVYSARVEGVHLRFGLVARGGLRWSDRREDFRTEILGLVKAQQVKNAVIVPVGSKGGFYVKRPPTEGGRDAFMAEGIECYKTFIRGLLDLTDNLTLTGKVSPPNNVLRIDGDDSYLVVAADKGTATFSDIANGVSDEYGFWLGDAFASGGSVGYDHKKMGITARGGWESVKRHFREAGHDIQKEPFTAIGVGDMAGDVFGNGMLLSEQTKLVAAFNHMHIFIDPNPIPAKSFIERKRLFDMPRSSWTDYEAKLISKGGGIFERSAKSIHLSESMKKMFNVSTDKMTPNELITAILKFDADLLWFGGIGTYVKAESESDVDVGDRTNDAIRVNGSDLKVRVIGEGANLGCTQRGRVEYALNGGRMNTDSIDNSAGVDCSDHEVNIKILLDQAIAAGNLTAGKARNSLLARMTDEVGLLVLRDNYLQTQAMTVIQSHGIDILDHQIRLMRMLEKSGRLNRKVEFLPDDETLAERALGGKGLSRPEIAVLMSYAKIWLFDELIDSDVPDDAMLAEDLVRYFPTALQKKYIGDIAKHRLRREIVATRVTNSLVNRVGATFVTQMIEKTGMPASDISRAYIIAREVFSLRSLWDEIEGLDNIVPAHTQTAMMLEANRLLDRATLWFLRNGKRPLDLTSNVKAFAKDVMELMENQTSSLPAHYIKEADSRAKIYIKEGVPKALALRVTGLVNLVSGCDIVILAQNRKIGVCDLARLYFSVGSRFRLGRLRAACETLESETHWQKLAVAAMIEELYGHQLALTEHVLNDVGSGLKPEAALKQWGEINQAAINRTEQLLSEMWSGDVNDLSMIAVASRSLSTLAQS